MSKLFVVSGPSGAGKSSLCHALLERCEDLKLSVSCTTRAPRAGEIDGEAYHFLSQEAFEKQIQAGAFLEWAKVHDHFYGTRASDVKSMLAQGFDVLLEIDWQGAAQVAAKMPDTKRIFILPPSIEVLKERLVLRGQDDMDVIERRVAAAKEEIAHAHEAHIQIMNDNFEQALQSLLDVFQP